MKSGYKTIAQYQAMVERLNRQESEVKAADRRLNAEGVEVDYNKIDFGIDDWDSPPPTIDEDAHEEAARRDLLHQVAPWLFNEGGGQ